MSAGFLIDGYNLLYAMGLLEGKTAPPGRLQQARARLLALLHHVFGAAGPAITVVFDAAAAPRWADDEQHFHAITVRFAVRQDQADDLIEELIRKSATPKQLTVVSDDHRVQRAAGRRQCVAQGCGEFLEELDRRQRRRRQRPPEAPEKRDGPTEAETRRWLEEFGDIEGDPQFRKLFEKYDFEE
jgi:predicted RNA-binding protein with PIN domain